MATAKHGIGQKAEKQPGKRRRTAPQSGVIPYRLDAEGGVEILLITSRETRRWVIPRGNIGKGMSAKASAAREAFEEAGIGGQINDTPLGFYSYEKVLKSGRKQPTMVEVYALHLTDQAKKWPEKKDRKFAWMRPLDAARQVNEPGLAILLLRLAEIHAVSGVLP